MQKLNNPEKASLLFEEHQDTMLAACLQGAMGEIYVDEQEKPASAIAVVGDFARLGGQPSEGLLREFARIRRQSYLILVGPDQGWNRLIEEVFGNKARAFNRYALKKTEHSFDKAGLQSTVEALKEGYVLKPIDEYLYHQCLSQSWSKDLVSLFPSYELYAEHGLGFCALKDGVVVSGASSYYYYPGGIEIEVDTHPEQRRQGLAAACSAKLILTCLQNGLFPSWDAHTKESLQLALRLGYQFDHEYAAYELLTV
nr:GNAT family N-acetyltransferase [uncultured Sphaerochaeta sp.]